MIYLSIIWHMHQPCYRDYLSGFHYAPWVRFHCTKDYLDMLLVLEEFPQVKQTFNLTPVLLEQIEYLNKGEEDYWFVLSRKVPGELSPQERDFIIDNFFSCNLERMISLFPRYRELYYRRNIRNFNDQDILDLQVMSNLAWIDPYFRFKDPKIKNIIKKARCFSEEDKMHVLECHKKIVSKVIPAYSKYVKQGQIEITTTPFYHPIMPLVYSTESARIPMPQARLPKSVFSFPEDAYAQIKEGKEYAQNLLGCDICGMWPSEQSVSTEVVSLLAKENIKWIVADEEILFKSLKRVRRTAFTLYRPYGVQTEAGDVNIVFRDRNLSDLIGFQYHRWKETDAVGDFIAHLHQIDKVLHKHDGLVVVALDGENAWEYYRWDGYDFLRELYTQVGELDFVRWTTVKEYLKKFPPKHRVRNLQTGSWIHADFYKWIGKPHKNYAWDLLAQARNLLKTKNLGPQVMRDALKQMYILEGSDWFWWQDDESDGMFDFLFRLHLKNFYTIMQEKGPDILNYPLTKSIPREYAE